MQTENQMLMHIIERQDMLIDKLDGMDSRIDNLDGKLSGHMHDEEKLFQRCLEGFPKKPDGTPDLDGHNLYHTAIIQESRDRAEMYRELKKNLLTKGIMGLISVLGILIMYWWNGQINNH